MADVAAHEAFGAPAAPKAQEALVARACRSDPVAAAALTVAVAPAAPGILAPRRLLEPW